MQSISMLIKMIKEDRMYQCEAFAAVTLRAITIIDFGLISEEKKWHLNNDFIRIQFQGRFFLIENDFYGVWQHAWSRDARKRSLSIKRFQLVESERIRDDRINKQPAGNDRTILLGARELTRYPVAALNESVFMIKIT